jgi:NAD(P)-dependent dehydrogenase (short-subunit alcohol dehydrogenase family)
MASANKAVIVTGAASGIGLVTTKSLLTAGHAKSLRAFQDKRMLPPR